MEYTFETLSYDLYIQRAASAKYCPKFNPTNENIEWAKWSWIPVTGCLHGCPYCYAMKRAENPFYAKGFPTQFRPTFHIDRLSAPDNHRIPAKRKGEPGINNVFLCSMADLYGDWVPEDWIHPNKIDPPLTLMDLIQPENDIWELITICHCGFLIAHHGCK